MRPYLQYSIAAGAALCVTAASLVAVGGPAVAVERALSSPSPPPSALTAAAGLAAAAGLTPAANVNGDRGPHAFYFTRGIYTSYGRGGWGRGSARWATDYPKADQQFLVVLRRLTNLDAYDSEHAVALNDPSATWRRAGAADGW